MTNAACQWESAWRKAPATECANLQDGSSGRQAQPTFPIPRALIIMVG